MRCLALSCSKANDWRLQKREEIFWNQEPSGPSNYSKIQAREGVSGGIGGSRASHGDGSLDRRTELGTQIPGSLSGEGLRPGLPGPGFQGRGRPHLGQQHISNLLNEVATVLPPLHQAIQEQGCGERTRKQVLCRGL